MEKFMIEVIPKMLQGINYSRRPYRDHINCKMEDNLEDLTRKMLLAIDGELESEA